MSNQNLSDRLIRIIESNAEELTEGTVKKLQCNPLTKSYHELSYSELYSRGYGVFHDLGRWLWEKSNEAVQAWYNELGEKRCEEGIPLSEVLWALVLTKGALIEYLGTRELVDSAMQLHQQREFDRLIGHFFDRAVCYTAQGYERQASEQKQSSGNDRELIRPRRFWTQAGLRKRTAHSHN